MKQLIKSFVAVPINFGMLSYYWGLTLQPVIARRSPHQFWNALLRAIQAQNNQSLGRSPHQFWNALLHALAGYYPAACCRSPHQFWNALLREGLEKLFIVRLSQSPSILECSPTVIAKLDQLQLTVAVPINFGMLSYRSDLNEDWGWNGRSPHQFWNALLPFTGALGVFGDGRSPHQFWNALLRRRSRLNSEMTLSQSPSILECSPTKEIADCPNKDEGRSPHQFWNALLQNR